MLRALVSREGLEFLGYSFPQPFLRSVVKPVPLRALKATRSVVSTHGTARNDTRRTTLQ